MHKLPHFIAYAIHRADFHSSVTFGALLLLQRLKAHFPAARGSSGHRLFLSAFMLASKFMSDDSYSNKSWCMVAQSMFPLREINKMEREMCKYLDWELAIDDAMLASFENQVVKDFSQDRSSYPNYPLILVSKIAPRDTSTAASNVSGSPITPPSIYRPVQYNCQVPLTACSDPNPAHLPRHSSTSLSVSSSFPTHWDTTSSTTTSTPLTTVSLSGNWPPSSPKFTYTEAVFSVHPLSGQMFALARPSRF
ncbi:hypothetical protein NMY22_g12950 [Coprinellus aureogranulatus]|nr:hypothetical protein NMY22_g12950 [Coprinellus aureogranulatus]